MSGTVVCRLDDLTSGAAAKFQVGDHSIAVVRLGDDVYAIGDTCSHADISLSDGEVLADNCEIECWKHGSRFSLKTGVPQTLPATVPVPGYVARVVDGMVEIDTEGAAA